MPGAVAPGGVLRVTVRDLALPARLELRRGGDWRPVGVRAVGTRRPVARLRAPSRAGILRIRARGADGAVTRIRRVTVRPLTLAAVGDVNLGDGPGAMMDRHGARYPWVSVGSTLSRADIAFANLECAVSDRGIPQPKQYVFRGQPKALTAMRRAAGIDVVNLANNHSGDYGDKALLDTLRHVRSQGMTVVGVGAHPHVLQPIRRPRQKLIAYSLGNFVFSAVSPGTSRTGILRVGFGRGRVMHSELLPATIRGSRPILDR